MLGDRIIWLKIKRKIDNRFVGDLDIRVIKYIF